MIIDSSNAVVPGVQIQAINEDTNIVFSTMTNSSGVYVLPALPPGRYRLQVSKAGFATLVKPDIKLDVQDAKAINFTLKVGAASETITVEGGAPLLNTENATVGTVVDRQFVENLPLNGRSFQSLFELTPGTVLTQTAFNSPGQFSVNGQRTDANYFTIDGVSANVGTSGGNGLNQTAGGAIPAFSALGGTSNLVSLDALQEFRIQTSSYAPEFGRTPGAQISIVTRSGTNELHGTLFEYLRNDVFDTTDWFANYNHQPKAKERQSDFGGVLGGPIFKNRLFFFLSYEGLRLRQPQFTSTDVPSLALRRNAPAQIQPLLNAFPIPNGPDTLPGFSQYSASYSNPAALDAGSGRLDYAVNEKLTLFGRFDYSPSYATARGKQGSLNNPNTTEFTTNTATAGMTWRVSPRLIDDLRFNWSRVEGINNASVDDFGGATPFPATLLLPAPFSVKDSSYSTNLDFSARNAGLFNGTNSDNIQRQINLVDNVSVATG
ncbi:MAG: carboxypeptidase regulatory-like domain-containing protein, partial [Terriglobales bacterium]